MKLNEAGLKQILDFKQLEKLLRNYSLTSGLDVALYSAEGEEQLCVRNPGCICEYGKGHFACRESIVFSGKKAAEIGSAYIYETPCGLIMCITPLVIEEELLGFITTGPVILWDKDEFFAEEFRKKCEKVGLDAQKCDPSDIRQIDCKSMTSIAETLTMLIRYMLQEERKYIEQRLEISKMNMERLRAAKEMQIRESQPHYNKYPIELEKELIASVQMGDKSQAKQIINRFFKRDFFLCERRSGDREGKTLRIYGIFVAQCGRGGGASCDADGRDQEKFTPASGKCRLFGYLPRNGGDPGRLS